MPRSNSTHSNILFERIIEHLLDDSSGSTLLERCMQPNYKEVSKIPLRYRLIALGFIEGYDLKQLNDKLDECGCARLYARNFWEATLIYAFYKGLSFEAWKQLESRCESYREQISEQDSDLSDKKITMSILREYINENSEVHDGRRVTSHVTRMMQETIRNSNEKLFQEWLKKNISSFSSVREKTRYYFCKYLLYYLESVEEQFIRAEKTGRDLEDILDKVSVFKIKAALKRGKLTEEEMREKFENAAISPGELFEAFNYFYFGYVSLDWMQVQFEYYGNPESIPPAMRKKFASSARKYDRSLKHKSDDEIIAWAVKTIEETENQLDEAYSKDNPGKGYQKDRSGENAVRKYIKGALDLDRTTLICFLIFFGSSCRLGPDQEITQERLNTIMRECGYTALDPDDDFDDFVIRFLDSDDPMMTLMDEVNQFALEEKNFHLYHLYRLSKNADQTWYQLMGMEE